jgi:type IV pilus assembly protein PilA
MKKKNNKKGFTLAELLIVVAIIAVLTAIAIPVFSKQLEKSREATDVANVRSAYATLMASYLQAGDGWTSGTVTVTAQQKTAGWEDSASPALKTMVNGVEGSIPIPAKTDSYVITIDSAGSCTIAS